MMNYWVTSSPATASPTTNPACTTQYRKLKENTRYTFILKIYTSIRVLCFQIFYTDGTYTSVSSTSDEAGISTLVIVTSPNKTVDSIKSILRNATRKLYFEESGIFEGVLTANDFEPYHADKISLSFPQTIYGGYVDLIKGEVVEEYVGLTVDDIGEFNMGNHDDYNGEDGRRFSKSVSTVFADDVNRTAMCNILPCVKQTNSSAYAKMITWLSVFINNGTSNQLYGCLKESYLNGDISKAGINNFLRSNNFLCTIKVATPTAYPLTPQSIKALRGLNNILTNANDNIDVKFYSH